MSRPHLGSVGRKPLGFGRGIAGSEPPRLTHEPLVLANYFEWFQASHAWSQWNVYGPLGHAWMPVMGEYASNTASVIADHVRQFKRAGLDGATLDYWGPTSALSLDATLQAVLDAWEEAGLRYAVYYEPSSILNPALLGKPAEYRQAMIDAGLNPDAPGSLYQAPFTEYSAGPVWQKYVLNPATGRYRDNYIWASPDGINFKPVLVLFDNCLDHDGNWIDGNHSNRTEANGVSFEILNKAFFCISPDLNLFSARTFDGGHRYNPIFLPGDNAANPSAPAWRAKCAQIEGLKGGAYKNKLFMATVIPGYNDDGINRDIDTGASGNCRARANGGFYDRYWRILDEAVPAADMIFVTSFNEYGEGSGIEETATGLVGTLSWDLAYGQQYLDLTREWSERWRKRKRAGGRQATRWLPNAGVAVPT